MSNMLSQSSLINTWHRTHSNARNRFQRFLVVALALLAALLPSAVSAAPFRLGLDPAELTVSEISDRTVWIRLAPLTDKGTPPAAIPSTAFVPLAAVEKLHVLDLMEPKEVRAGHLRITVHSDPITISIRTAEGRLVQELLLENSGDTNSLRFKSEAPVFGLGEGEHQFDRRDHYYPMRNGQLPPTLATNGATIPVPWLIGADGWAMFVLRPWGRFDLHEQNSQFLFNHESFQKSPLDLFIVSWEEPKDALAEYVRFTGHPVMPPKWVMGYIQSHRTLAGPEEPLELAKTFREKQLPCDALIYLGTGYCTNGWNTGHGSLSFNPNAFDHPPEQIRALHDLNFKVILHINHAPRELFGTTMPLPKATAASPTEDFSSPNHIYSYWARHRDDEALGVDGWWPDDGDELPIEARLARHRCYYEGPLLDHTNSRPWSLHRNGYAGVARYGGWIWSGDVESRWATLAAHVPVGLNDALSLTPFWGTDTGGFIPTREFTGELYVRWFQFSAFNPLFRSHGRTWHLRLPWGWNTGETGPIESRDVTDPAELNNDQVEPICKKFLELRYQLLPYNYTLMREACDTGLPPMRALWLHYPNDPEVARLGDEYLWGRDLLVAPVVEQGATNRHLYLPPGTWYDWWKHEKLEGGRWVDRAVELATMPLFVRAGAIIPLDPVRQYTAQSVTQPTTLMVFPGVDGSFTMYDDDGTSLDYLKDIALWTDLRWDDRSQTLTVQRDDRSKSKKSTARKFDVVIAPTGVSKQVEFTGRKAQAKFR
jgi:alpha-glucosidase (family GH31 glycosyl hydrolase)